MPRAHELAKEAGLSLRTVFRHIEDMESLFSDLAEQIYSDIIPVLMRPYSSTDWREQLKEALERRIEIHEKVMPFKLAADLRRYRSPTLMASYKRSIELERAQLQGLLPRNIQSDEVTFSALQLAMSFQCWRRLRNDQSLSEQTARDVVAKMVAQLIAENPRNL